MVSLLTINNDELQCLCLYFIERTGLYLVDSSQTVQSVGQETHHDRGHYEEAAHQDSEYEEGGTVSVRLTGWERGGAGGVVTLAWPGDGQTNVVSEVQ